MVYLMVEMSVFYWKPWKGAMNLWAYILKISTKISEFDS